MGKLFAWLLFVISTVSFAASLVIHLATYFDTVLMERRPAIWGVYVIVGLLFIYCFVDARARTRAKGKVPMFTRFGPSGQTAANFVAGAFLVCALVIFAIGFLTPTGGRLGRLDGRPAPTKGGRIVRELTEREYQHLNAVEIRGFSAMLLLFSVANTCYPLR